MKRAKTPIVHRLSVGGFTGRMRVPGFVPPLRSSVIAAACSAAALGPWIVQAQTPPQSNPQIWTAEDAVARALSRPELGELREAGRRQVRAEVEELIVLPAPTLGLTHEEVGGDDGVSTREFSAMVEQSFDLFPWRGRMKESLEHRESAFLAEDDGLRLEIAAEVRTAFYAVLYHQRRVVALAGRVDRLEAGWEALLARERRGDASNYEVRRVERELLVARAEEAREESSLDEAWLDLRVWCSWDARPSLVGDLAPPAPGLGAESQGPLPGLVRLEHLGRSLDAELRASGKSFLRGWVLGAGYRHAESGSESGDGALLALSLPLPIWNADRPRQDRLRAERTRIESEIRLERQRIDDAVDSAASRLARLLDVIVALPPAERESGLTDQAEVAYAAGEATLAELLDAYESEAELELARTDLEWEARRASIELDRHRGMGVPR